MVQSYVHADGIEQTYGPDQARPNILGHYRYDGPVKCVEIRFDYADLPAYDASDVTIIRDNFTLPRGVQVERVEIFTTTAWDSSGDALTLDVGIVDTDRGLGDDDGDYFVVAATQAELITGGTNVAGWVGAAVGGAATTAPKLLTWKTAGATATAGEGYIRIYYSVIA